MDAAASVSNDDFKANVALLNSATAPRVLHDPVLDVGLDAPADNQCFVIVSCATGGIVLDTTLVLLEGGITCSD